MKKISKSSKITKYRKCYMKCLNIKGEENKNKRLGPFVALAVKNYILPLFVSDFKIYLAYYADEVELKRHNS